MFFLAKSLSESRHLKVKQDKIYENGPNLFELENIFENELVKDIDPKLLLKWPIHIWVSSGEPFIHPDGKILSPLKYLSLNFLN